MPWCSLWALQCKVLRHKSPLVHLHTLLLFCYSVGYPPVPLSPNTYYESECCWYPAFRVAKLHTMHAHEYTIPTHMHKIKLHWILYTRSGARFARPGLVYFCVDSELMAMPVDVTWVRNSSVCLPALSPDLWTSTESHCLWDDDSANISLWI